MRKKLFRTKSKTRRKKMEITDIKVRKLFDEGPMKAIVSVTFDAQLAVHDIKVIHARDKFFIVMPSRKNPDETYRDIVHPINATFRAKLEEAVINAFHDAVEQAALLAESEEEIPAEV
jgi:stage V sporulation protein G